MLARLKAAEETKNPTIPVGVRTVDKNPPPSVVSMIDQVIAAKAEKVPYFRPSMLAGCARMNMFFYESAPSEEPKIEPTFARILDTGTALHSVVQGYLAGHRAVFFSPEVPVYHPQLEIKGSCDGIFTRRHDGYRWGLEFKTIGAEFAKLSGPKEHHVFQATVYAKLAGVRWMTLLYWGKERSAIKEYQVEADDRAWAFVVKRVTTLQAMARKKLLPVFNQEECDANVDLCRYRTHCEQCR